jgi:hypothetical protein
METVITRIQEVLQQEFSSREIRVEPAGRGKVDGWIISKSFEGVGVAERYQKVRKLLDASLPKKDRNRILGFFLITPLEEKMIFEEDFDVLATSRKKKSSPTKKSATPAGRKSAGEKPLKAGKNTRPKR